MTDYDSNRKIWEQRLSNFENSEGVSVKAWCKSNGVSDPGFRYWRRKFKKEKTDADSPAFMPVEVMIDAALSKLLKVVKSLC